MNTKLYSEFDTKYVIFIIFFSGSLLLAIPNAHADPLNIVEFDSP